MPAVPDNKTMLEEIASLRHQVKDAATQQLFIITDDDLIARVLLGLLPNGDFGIIVADDLGNSQEILPESDNYWNGTLSTSSTSPVSLTNSPSVSALIGANADVIIEVGSFIGVPASGEGLISVTAQDISAGGSLTNVGQIVAVSTSGSAIATNSQSRRRWSQAFAGFTLIPGNEVQFGLQYQSSSGTSNFSSTGISVTPV